MSPRRKIAALLSAALVATAAVGALAESSAQAAPGCQVDYSVTNQWNAGFGANVKVTNLGDPVTSWTVDWTFASGQKVTQLWNGAVTQSGANVSVANLSWNGGLATGASTSFGFNGSWSGSNAVPTTFKLNGVTCTGTVPTPTATPTPTPTATPTPTPTPTPSGDFWVNPNTQAATAANAATGDTKTLLNKIALTSAATWITNSNASAAQQLVSTVTSAAAAQGKIAVLVIYAIPGRDCGNYSSGGVATSAYAAWIDTVAAGIQGKPWIILEPDALAQLGDCSGQGDRVGYLQYAAKSLTLKGGQVYIDAGHSAWLSVSTAVSRLNQVGFAYAVGFALNTSNYQTTAASQSYGQQVSSQLGGKTFVIDTSRNGNGSNGQWCNPSGRALGERPTKVGSGGLDALVWVKLPGESDGACNGGPAAGQWFQSIALELARNAKW